MFKLVYGYSMFPAHFAQIAGHGWVCKHRNTSLARCLFVHFTLNDINYRDYIIIINIVVPDLFRFLHTSILHY